MFIQPGYVLRVECNSAKSRDIDVRRSKIPASWLRQRHYASSLITHVGIHRYVVWGFDNDGTSFVARAVNAKCCYCAVGFITGACKTNQRKRKKKETFARYTMNCTSRGMSPANYARLSCPYLETRETEFAQRLDIFPGDSREAPSGTADICNKRAHVSQAYAIAETSVPKSDRWIRRSVR